MRLIGIKLLTAEPVVKRSLFWNTWYPFGNYEEPDLNTKFPLLQEDPDIENLYQIVTGGQVPCHGGTSTLDTLNQTAA